MFNNHGSALYFFGITIGWKLEALFFLWPQGWLLMRGGFQSYYSGAEASKRGTSASFVFSSFCDEF